MKIVSVDEMRRIEKATAEAGQTYSAMMDMAGQSVASIAARLTLEEPDSAVLVLVGPGNNGGDGLVAARYLLEMEHHVTLYVWKRDIKGDDNFRLLKRRRRGIAILWADNDPEFEKLREEVRKADVVIDALLGTGVARPLEGSLAALTTAVREEVAIRRTEDAEDEDTFFLGVPRFPIMEAFTFGEAALAPDTEWDGAGSPIAGDGLDDLTADGDDDLWGEDWEDSAPLPWPPPVIVAIDCPSGLDCDTGYLDPAALPADLTITFGFPKWGQLQYPGAAACGLLSVTDIGVPRQLADGLQAELLEPAIVARWLPARPADAHKGTFGRAMIAAGSLSYTGAAALSASAATRAGAGLVTLAIPAPLHAALAGNLPEVTWAVLPSTEGTHCAAGAAQLLGSLSGYDALLVGPGLTTGPAAREFIETLFSAGGLDRDAWAGRTVVDADALNILAAMPAAEWPGRLPPRSILTPHPGEMGRLIGETAEAVNARRAETARRWAAEWGHVVLLKGPYSIIADPDGRAAVAPFALASLATAGSGDVLAGAIAALLAQGLPPFEAAACGAYLHAFSGALAAREIGPAGGLARDILGQMPAALTRLYSRRP